MDLSPFPAKGLDIGELSRAQTKAKTSIERLGYTDVKISDEILVYYNIKCCVGKPPAGEVTFRLYLVQTVSAKDSKGNPRVSVSIPWRANGSYRDAAFASPGCCKNGCRVSPLPKMVDTFREDDEKGN
jgi:hypothetical protein